MKATTQKLSSVFILFSTIACLNGYAQISAFTYQGKLDVNGAPANGRYDFNFRLLDDPINGTAAPVIPISLNVLVSNGLFTTAMDFGAQNITGSPQWLEINVTTNGGGTFTALSPRQLLTSAPYAVRSLSASNLLGTLPAAQLSGTILAANFANGTITSNLLANNSVNVSQLTTNIGVWTRAGTNIFYNTGNVGVGTTNPQTKFQVTGPMIAGGPSNSIAPGFIASTIAGGGIPGFPNVINSESSFIGAGNLNLIDTNLNNSFIGAGFNNTIRSVASFIGSGNFNAISTNSTFGFIGGGSQNLIQYGANNSSIGGGGNNSIQPGANFSTIAGGVNNFIGTNSVGSTISGGGGNQMQSGASYGFIGGGSGNTIQSNTISATIVAGSGNTIRSNTSYSILAGGYLNGTLSGASVATLSGGYLNTNGGFGSTIPGGTLNAALGDYSFAAGVRAKALHYGSFVWADGLGIDFASTAANQFLIRASGGVGIGTSNPAAAVHIVSDVPYPHLKVSAGSNAPYGAFLSMDATALTGGKEYFIFSTGAFAGEGQGKLVFQDYTDGKQLMAFTSGGDVGIGTVSPQATLHVIGTESERSAKIEASDPIGTWLNLANTSSGGGGWSIISSGTSNGEGPGQLLFHNNPDPNAFNGSTRMIINTNGYVGIGTVFPQATLDVVGSVRARGGAPGPSGIDNNGFMFGGAGDNDSGMSSSANGQIEFYSDSLEVMRIAQGGNVGIGTNSPQAKLHVNGDIKANGKVLMGTGGTNYATDSIESLRIVRGTIGSAGNIVKGSGFTVSHPGPGGYTINFTTPFADVPTVTATAVNIVVRLGATISTSSVSVGTANFGGAATDDAFHFIAIGPQ